ncbi:HD family phosphohydrolase [Planctomycetota bacterium]
MVVFGRQQSGRRRTRHVDLEGVGKRRRSGLASALAPKHLLDTLAGVAFWLLQTVVVTAGVPHLDPVSTGGVAALLLAANLLFAWYLSLHHRAVLNDRRRLLLIHALTLSAIALAKIFVVLGWPVYLIPLAIFSVALSVGVEQRLGVLWTVLVAAIMGLCQGIETVSALTIDLPLMTTLAAGSLVAIYSLDKVSRRSKVVRAGFFAGLTFAAMIVVTEVALNGRPALAGALYDPDDMRRIAFKAAFGFLNGIFTGYFLVEFGLRFVESTFDVVTDLRLQELADLNQPILKKFAMEVPGTFHHSQMVGTLAEAAAESIGANPLLCRVAAHFHDIGKLAKPEYFIENVQGPTRHESLTPTMSTLIIIGHVKDGVEIAEELSLPSSVIDCIPQHHGTVAVEYFYHQAKALQKKEGGPQVSREDFRYPGPKPRSREAAILMIADTVEAISRVLEDPNHSRLRATVHDVIMRRLREGQLDECSLTIRELTLVEEAMFRVLVGVRHARIKYPKPSHEEVIFAPPGESRKNVEATVHLADGPGVPSPASAAGPERSGAGSAEVTNNNRDSASAVNASKGGK